MPVKGDKYGLERVDRAGHQMRFYSTAVMLVVPRHVFDDVARRSVTVKRWELFVTVRRSHDARVRAVASVMIPATSVATF